MTIPQTFALALQHHQAGRLAEAEALCRQILAVQPNHTEALHRLGVIAHQMGRRDLAVVLIQQAIVFCPNNPAAHFDLGTVLVQQGQLDEAVTAFHRALTLKPDYPEAHLNLGTALARQDQFGEAAAAFRRALELKPNYPNAYRNLGAALIKLNKLDEAIAASRRGLQLEPDHPDAHYNLGTALSTQGHFEEAIAALRRTVELKSDYPEASLNLGNALKEQGRLDEAVATYRRVLQLHPDYAEAHNNLGSALEGRGELDEAIAARRRATQLKPEHPLAQSNLIYALHFHPGLDPETIAKERARWNRQFSDPLKPFIRPHANDRAPERRLRIGYVSPDFRDHVVGRNLAPLVRCHDREQCEIVCYSGVLQPDGLTEEFRQRADQWRSTVGVTDEALAEMIRQDGVDIFVDLTQHMAGNRLPVFARQPAPVQVSFAGYPESAGLGAIGYRISDRYVEGGANDLADVSPVRNVYSNIKNPTVSMATEQVCMIDSFWCYDPCGVDVAVNGLPAQENGRVTFGSLNNFCKVNESLFRLWARVLRKVRDSRLLILSHAGSHRQRAVENLKAEGVEVQRVEFVEPRGRRAYLELYHQLDIVLDPFPYNGHSTSLDALWMGVPVISLVGERAV